MVAVCGEEIQECARASRFCLNLGVDCHTVNMGEHGLKHKLRHGVGPQVVIMAHKKSDSHGA